MNAFPKKIGISKTFRPTKIMVGTPQIDNNHATFQHGAYVHFKVKKGRKIDTKNNERGSN